MKQELLDNPVWNSLSETHKKYVVQIGDFKFYKPAYCPFGALTKENANGETLMEYAGLVNNFYVVGSRPPDHPKGLRLVKELICNQMVIAHTVKTELTEEIIPLHENYKEELTALVNLVQPGYFREKTADLGNYSGIFRDKKLVAVTGERMQMKDAVEVSAVVTHPGHTGNGYAKQLVSYVTNKILGKNKLPFLHVAETNAGAIRLYEKLGFTTRRKMSFWNYSRL